MPCSIETCEIHAESTLIPPSRHPPVSPAPLALSPFAPPALPPCLRWVVWMAGPGMGVTVGGFPRCEADFIAERSTWCVISRDSPSLLPLPSSVSVSVASRIDAGVLMKKGSDAIDVKPTSPRAALSTESGMTFLSTKRSRSTPRVLVPAVARERTTTNTSRRCIRLVFAKGADNYLRPSRICDLHAILSTRGCSTALSLVAFCDNNPYRGQKCFAMLSLCPALCCVIVKRIFQKKKKKVRITIFFIRVENSASLLYM